MTHRLRSVLARLHELLWFGAVPVALVLAVTVGQALGHRRQGWHYAIDFHTFWDAGQAVLHGRSPYESPAAVAAHPNDIHAFVYPAPVALAFAPLGALGYPLAAAIYTLFVLAALALSLRLLGVSDWRCYGVAFCWLPVMTSVSVGTITPLLILGISTLWRYREHAVVAGLALAALVTAKLFVWPLALWLLLTRRLGALALSLVVTVTAAASAWWLIGFAGFRQYPELLRTIARLESRHSGSLATLLAEVGLGWRVSTLLGLGLGLLGIYAASRASGPHRDLSLLTAALAASLLALPKLNMHYYALVLIPVAIAARRLSWPWFMPLAFWVTEAHAANTLWRTSAGLAVAGAVLWTANSRRVQRQSPPPTAGPWQIESG